MQITYLMICMLFYIKLNNSRIIFVKNTLRTISYTIFHLMILLSFADSLDNERFIAAWSAFIAMVIFITVRPTFEEWKKSCAKRTFFYFMGFILFLGIGYYGKMEIIDTWQDMNGFILYFKLCGLLLFIKWIYGNILKNKFKYTNKLNNDLKQSFIGKL